MMKVASSTSRIGLKRILAKKETLDLVSKIVTDIDWNRCRIWDPSGKLLLGSETEEAEEKYPVELSGEAIGWVEGGKGAESVALLLSHLAKKELEKKQLANEALDKYREITLLYDISQKLTACLDVKEVAKLALDEAQRPICATRGSVMSLNWRTGQIEILAAFGQDAEETASIKLGEGIVGSIIASGVGEIVNEVAWDPRRVEGEMAVQSLICVPLKTKDRAIGAIALGSTEPHTYTAADLKLLTMVASQAASALENAILHECKLEESRREALLFRLASQIRYSLDVDTILETAVSEIRSLLDIDRCFFMWYRPYAAQKAWEVVKESRNQAFGSLLGYYRADEIGAFTAKLIDRQAVRADSVRDSADPQMREFFVKRGLTSILALPIQTRSGEIGTIACGSCDRQRPWSDREVDLLQAVANQLAIAIEHAEMYEKSRTAATQAQAQAQQLQQTIEELKETQSQLIQSEKMSGLGQMVAGIAHEINNPVNFIYGNLEHAKQYSHDLLGLLDLYQQHYGKPNPEIEDEIAAIELDFLKVDFPNLLSSMLMGTERIRGIVQSLRNFSRLDEAQMKPVDVHEGIDSTLLILQHRFKPKAGRSPLEIVKAYDALPQVECYASSLNQVFMNILSNAIDALEEQPHQPGKIFIHTEVGTGHWAQEIGDKRRMSGLVPFRGNSPDGDRYASLAPYEKGKSNPPAIANPEYIVIRIRDNGPGIPEEVQKRLFDPFFTTKPVGKGTGLGLSIAYRIVVEKHGGRLACFSKPGEGTEFAIMIPVKQAISSKPQSQRLARHESSKILTS